MQLQHYRKSYAKQGGLLLLVVVALLRFLLAGPLQEQGNVSYAVTDCSTGIPCDFDGVCDACESSVTCKNDCHTCGNSICEPHETNSNCQSDCATSAVCGNRNCETGEDASSCSTDCALCVLGTQERIFSGGCSDRGTNNIGVTNICACGDYCPANPARFNCLNIYTVDYYDPEETCNNGGINDDTDGQTDCDDSDCSTNIECGAGTTAGSTTATTTAGTTTAGSTTATTTAGTTTAGSTTATTTVGSTTAGSTTAGSTAGGTPIGEDKNFDTIDDGLQTQTVKTIAAASGGIEVTLSITGNNCFIHSFDTTTQGQNDGGYMYPYGLFSFAIWGGCFTVTVDLFFHTSDYPLSAVYRKQLAAGWSTINHTKTSQQNYTKIRFSIADNGVNDTDVNIGTIRDPGGPALIVGGGASGYLWPIAICGNRHLEYPPEKCDDGNTINGDGCNAACQSEGNIVGGGGGCDEDGICDAGESYSGCPRDCLTNIAKGAPSCGDGACQYPETKASCSDCSSPAQHCGNYTCEASDGENGTNCPSDCCNAEASPNCSDVVFGAGCMTDSTIGYFCGACIHPNQSSCFNQGTAQTVTQGIQCDYFPFGAGSEICDNGGVDDDLDGLTDCEATVYCANHPACGGNGGTTSSGTTAGSSTAGSSTSSGTTAGGTTSSGTTAGSTTAGGTTAGGSTCEDGIVNGTETDVDCGGNCPDCLVGKQCSADTDCISANCSADFQQNVTIHTADERYFSDRIIIKFASNTDDFYLPNFGDTALLNTKEKYLGYLIGKAVQEYLDTGISTIPSLQTLDSIFNYAPDRIERLFPLVDADDVGLRSIMRVTLAGASSVDAMIDTLSRQPGIEYVEKEPLYTISVNDPQVGGQWYIAKTEADKAWTAGANGSSNVVVAVLDNAFETTHPDLSANLVAGRDAADNDADVNPPSSWYSTTYGGHGTHTAGLVAAVTNNGQGISAISNNVHVMPIKATSSSYPPQYVTHAYEALQYAVSRPEVDIISMSFGGPLSQAMQSLIAAHPEKIYVAAAGNTPTQTPQYPAAFPGVYAVAASTQGDTKASFSTYGSWIDITAPGVGILSTDLNGSYATHDGTSSATPIVASLAALLVSVGINNPLQVITQTADAMPNSSAYTSGLLGAGRINVCRAVSQGGIACSTTSTATGGVVSGSTAGSTDAGGSTAGSTTGVSAGIGLCLPIAGSTTAGGTTNSGTTAGSTTAGSTTAGSSVTTGDADGVSDAIEQAAPNNGDGNYDGIQDSTQKTVTSILGKDSYLTLDVGSQSGSSCSQLSAVQSIPSTSNPGYSYPYGMLSFTAGGCAPTTKIRTYRHNVTNRSSYQFHKQLASSQIVPLQSVATTLTTGLYPAPYLEYSLPSQNGVIIDPVGIALTSNAGTSTTTSTGQSYPVGTIDISVNDSTATPKQTLQWTVNFDYTTFSGEFPLGRLQIVVSLPQDIDIVTSSIDSDSDGIYLGHEQENDDHLFGFDMSGTPSSATNTTKRYQGTIQFSTTMNTNSSSARTRASVSCYRLSSSSVGYVGTQTCSSSSSVTNAITMATDSVSVSIDQGSSNTTNTTSNTSNTSTNTSSTTAIVCGNGKLEGSEACDDGSVGGDDGCVGCRITSGRRCTQTSPSQCGTIDCIGHGSYYGSKNIFATCCEGLEVLSFPKQITVLSGTESINICYDSAIDTPLCYTEKSPSGWWMKKTAQASGLSLLLQDSCELRYQDYYKQLLIRLQQQSELCAFNDDTYEKVRFSDIAYDKQVTAIEALKELCIVKGVGSGYNAFEPQQTITRAEFIKMLVKILSLSDAGSGLILQPERYVYSGDTYFADVSHTFWGAQYIAYAYKQGLLRPFLDTPMLASYFQPHRSLKVDEVVDVLRLSPRGQFLTKDTMIETLGSRYTVTRAAIAALLVKKFLPDFEEYFYFQGEQEEYYRSLAEKLRGKSYREQYRYLLEQIRHLEEETNNTTRKKKKLDVRWMRKFLMQLIAN